MSTEVKTTGGDLIAVFEEYADAVRVLPAMARILRESLKIEEPSVYFIEGNKEPLPGGCFIDWQTPNSSIVRVIALP